MFEDSFTFTYVKLFAYSAFDFINARDIEILDRADSDYKLKLKEAMYINKLKPQLNVQHAASYKRKHNKEMFKCRNEKFRIKLTFLTDLSRFINI